MSPAKWLLAYLLTFLVFLAIDLLWLGVLARDLYQRHLGALMAERVNWMAALLFYALYIAGIFLFVILPALEKQSWSHALVYGALLGMLAYATYDLTNLATLRSWPIAIVPIDIAWGTILTGLVGLSGFLLTRLIRDW